MTPQRPFYQFVHASHLPTPGACAYAFESEMLALRPAIGPGIGYRAQFRSVSPTPQYYQAQVAMWQSGLAGNVHGQSIMQPLSDPYAG